MSEPVPRVPPPGGAPAGGKKERGSIDEDQFKKIMRVEEVHEIDPHQKRSRKRREEAEGEAEEEVKKADTEHGKKPAKPIEGVAGTPLERKKVAPKTPTPSPVAPPTGKATPMAAFRPEEIEAYAWEEEAESTPPSSTAHPAAARAEGSKEAAPQMLKGEAGAKTPEPPPPAAEPPPPQRALFAPDGDVIKEEPPQPTEEWPHTYALRPTAGFRSSEAPPPEAAPEAEKAPPIRRRAAEKPPEDEESRRTKAPPKKKAKETAPPPGMPLPPGKKEKAASFAELMEEGVEKGKESKAKSTAKEKIAPQKAAAEPMAPPQTPEERAAEAAAKAKAPVIPPHTPEEKAAAAIAAKELPPAPIQGIPSAEESFAFLKKTGGATISPEKAEKEEKEQEAGALLPAAGQLPERGAGEGGESGGEKREGEAEEMAAIASAPSGAAPIAPHIEAPAPVAPSPYAQMSPQILALFERMVGVMTIIQTTGITETVLTLNARQFATSVLYGSQIIIREYSTAPTKFNVEFIGSPQALALVQGNIPALLGAVQQGNFNFTINRFDVKLSGTERPIFSRKEPTEGKGDEEKKEDKEKETP